MKGNKIMTRTAALLLAAGVLLTDVSSIYAAEVRFGGTADATGYSSAWASAGTDDWDGTTESAEMTETTGAAETTATTETTGEAEAAGTTEATEMTGETETTETTETTEETEETETTEEIEATETTEETETTETTETTEETEATETTEETEATEVIEETEETEDTEDIEETEETEAVEETEGTEDTEILETDSKKSANAVSKVIGVEAGASFSSFLYNNVRIECTYLAYNGENHVLLSDALANYYDSATGFYKYGNQYYIYGATITNKKCALWGRGYYVSKTAPQKDTTGAYLCDGKYFSEYWTNGQGYYYFTYYQRMELVTKLTDGSSATTKYGIKAKSTDSGYAYYNVNGRYFRKIWQSGVNVFGYLDGEILFDSAYHKLTWTPVTNPTQTTSGGDALYVGYQIRANGKLVPYYFDVLALHDNAIEGLFTDTSAELRYPAGQSVKYEVRAVYYKKVDEKSENDNVIVKVGAWSDPVTFAYTAKSTKDVPAVKNLKAKKNNDTEYTLSWDAVPDAGSYRLEYYASETALDDDTLAKVSWYKYGSVATNKQTVSIYDMNAGYRKHYFYFRVCAVIDYHNNVYHGTMGEYSNIINMVRPTSGNVEQVKNLKFVKEDTGGFRLQWDKVDDNTTVRIYYSMDQKLLQGKAFLYQLANPKAESKDLTSPFGSSDQYYVDQPSVAGDVATAAAKVSYVSVSGVNTMCPWEVFSDIVPGQTYYFVAVTYDSTYDLLSRPDTTPYSITRKDSTGATQTLKYPYYVSISEKSKIVSGKMDLGMSKPRIESTKSSVKLYFYSKSSIVTGYEIYRKNSKGKYKKIATISSNAYEDTDLKAGTNYRYKARAYAYNPTTKKTAYGIWVYFNADTSQSNYLQAKAAMTSKNSIKIKWNKVKNVKKYEIYRNYTTMTSDTFAKKNSSSTNQSTNQAQTKSVLVKTITGSKTTSYTDKKLEQGNTYSYTVYAYYKDTKNGKTKKLQSRTDSVELSLTQTTNLKVTIQGSTAKVSWDANPYAKKYELRYRIVDSAGTPYSDQMITKSVKKNSYSITGINLGDTVTVYVAGCGTGNIKSAAVSASEKRGLATVSDVKATATGNGKVTISWKAVAGAKYYEVYRSTCPAQNYVTESKSYKLPRDAVAIAKEINDDETNNSVAYKQYRGISNSVTSNSVVDANRLDTGVKYYYYVIAYGTSSWIASAGYSKPASYTHDVKADITKITASKGKTTLTLATVKGAKSYEIYRSTSKNKGYKKIGTSKKATYVDKKTKKGKTYYYKVVAKGTNALKGEYKTAKSSAKKIKAK